MKQKEIRGLDHVGTRNTSAAEACTNQQATERGLLGKQDQLMHAAWLEDFMIVGADVAFIVDFKQYVGVALFFHNPLDSLLNRALDGFFVTHSLVLAEVENSHNRGHAKIVGSVQNPRQPPHGLHP